MDAKAIAPFGVRMPPDLKEKLSAEAKKNKRSMNNELIIRLEKSLKGEGIEQAA